MSQPRVLRLKDAKEETPELVRKFAILLDTFYDMTPDELKPEFKSLKEVFMMMESSKPSRKNARMNGMESLYFVLAQTYAEHEHNIADLEKKLRTHDLMLSTHDNMLKELTQQLIANNTSWFSLQKDTSGKWDATFDNLKKFSDRFYAEHHNIAKKHQELLEAHARHHNDFRTLREEHDLRINHLTEKIKNMNQRPYDNADNEHVNDDENDEHDNDDGVTHRLAL